MTKTAKEPKHISDAVATVTKGLKIEKPSPKKDRIIKAGYDIFTKDIGDDEKLFHHSILCQTVFPYKNPKDEIFYERQQGNACMTLQAQMIPTHLRNTFTKDDSPYFGLPYGAMARVMLLHFNTLALLGESPTIELHNSLKGTLKEMGYAGTGRQMNQAKEQLRRIVTTNITLYYTGDNRLKIENSQIIKGIDISFNKDENQRLLWNDKIFFNTDYYNSLAEHAVPLDMRAVRQLQDSALELDIYAWLAQRLHRIKGTQFITWNALWQQFGQNYSRIDKFKTKFRGHLKKVLAVYPTAKLSENKNKGFTLYNSPPPVPKNYVQIPAIEGK